MRAGEGLEAARRLALPVADVVVGRRPVGAGPSRVHPSVPGHRRSSYEARIDHWIGSVTRGLFVLVAEPADRHDPRRVAPGRARSWRAAA